MLASEVLFKAAELVNRGWVRRTFQTEKKDGTPCYCAWGAIKAAAGDLASEELAVAYLAAELDLDLGYQGCAKVVAWNDQRAPDGRAVARKLRKAARKAQKEEKAQRAAFLRGDLTTRTTP